MFATKPQPSVCGHEPEGILSRLNCSERLKQAGHVGGIVGTTLGRAVHGPELVSN